MINQYTASLGNGQYLIDLDGHLSSSYQSTASFSDDLNLVRNEFSSSYSQLSSSAPRLISRESNFSPNVDIIPNVIDNASIWIRDLKDRETDWVNFGLLDKSGSWTTASASNYFPKLNQMISNLPFKGIGRVFVIVSETGISTLTHQDHDQNWRPEHIWIDLTGNRKLYVANQSDTLNWYLNGFDDNLLTKSYMTGSTCWFDPSKAHGVSASARGLSAAIRIDGEYTTEFRQQIFNDSTWHTVNHFVSDVSLMSVSGGCQFPPFPPSGKYIDSYMTGSLTGSYY
jgi:hypothetical protein